MRKQIQFILAERNRINRTFMNPRNSEFWLVTVPLNLSMTAMIVLYNKALNDLSEANLELQMRNNRLATENLKLTMPTPNE